MAKFNVDTKLFRELGELLVGRESTALVELVKNAYDADARNVTILGKNLRETECGAIVVEDDGVGMTPEIFERGFLTIAGRTKVEGEVRSAVFKRRFTGEKGVGRLAAHKLAGRLEVLSRRWDGSPFMPDEPLEASGGVSGVIDWDKIEKLTTLADVEQSDALQTEEVKGTGHAGTRLTLARARRSWAQSDFDEFFNDVATLVPAAALVEPLSAGVVPERLLFVTPTVRETDADDPGLQISYAGDFKTPATDLPVAAEAAAWVIEVECDPAAGQVRIAVEPTVAALRLPKFRDAEGWASSYAIPKDQGAIAFCARIFETEGEKWPKAFRGVKVYLEGFRIPPYGDPSDDWLGLDNDYRSRGRGELGRLRRFSQWDVPEGDEGEGLTIKGNNHYFGAVFLTREGAADLKMLVNREGFLPSPGLTFLIDTLRFAIGVQVRQRRLASHEIVGFRKADARHRREVASRTEEGVQPAAFQAKALHDEASAIVREVRTLTAAGNATAASERLNRLEEVVAKAGQLSAEGMSEAVMFRVLASIGLEQAAFVHEILGLGITAETVAAGLSRLGASVGGDAGVRLRALAAEARDLRERLRRNGIYLADMTGVEARRRRSRLKLRDRFETTADYYRPAASRRGVAIENAIPGDLTSPPMFPAEVAALFSNLLSNAVKFAGPDGRVRATGRDAGNEVTVTVENTGTGVDLATGERWFEPFRSTTHEVDPTLGQGMGLGLTVSRSLMDEYGGVMRFVAPSTGFATALELRWPKR